MKSTIIPLLLFTVFTNFLSQILLKRGMSDYSEVSIVDRGVVPYFFSVATNAFVISGLVVMVVSMASHLVVLSKADISFAYPFLGLSFVLITVYGHYVLHEPLNAWKIFGVLFIVTGVVMVAQS